MKALLKKTGNTGAITLEGELTLPYAEELRGVLIKALEDNDEVSISMEKVQDVDLSCLQLLCSAHRSAMRSQKKVMLSKDLPMMFTAAVEGAGFSRLKGCKYDKSSSCIWISVTGERHAG